MMMTVMTMMMMMVVDDGDDDFDGGWWMMDVVDGDVGDGDGDDDDDGVGDEDDDHDVLLSENRVSPQITIVLWIMMINHWILGCSICRQMGYSRCCR